MFSSYQHQSTNYGNLSLGSGHAIIDDLHRRAARLAPRFYEDTNEAGCSNLRPGADEPRKQQVWDMLAEALGWNLIADDVDTVLEAKRLEDKGITYQPVLITTFVDRDARQHAIQHAHVVIIEGRRLSWQEEDRIAIDAPKLIDLMAGVYEAAHADQVAATHQEMDEAGWTVVKEESTRWGLTTITATTPEGIKVTISISPNGSRHVRGEAHPGQVKVGDVIWTNGFRVQVEEVEEFKHYDGQTVWQARGPVTNYDELIANDPGLKGYLNMDRRGRPGWWTAQGNTLARLGIEVSL